MSKLPNRDNTVACYNCQLFKKNRCQSDKSERQWHNVCDKPKGVFIKKDFY